MLRATLILSLGLCAAPSSDGSANLDRSPDRSLPDPVAVTFTPAAEAALPASERERLASVVRVVEMMTRWRLDGLPEEIRVRVDRVERDLSSVGEVSGRADEPGSVLIELSADAADGAAAWERGLVSTLFHEFHHLGRGWTIEGNRFGPGIPTAAVNEGLAQVFAEEASGVRFARFDYPPEADAWLDEILALPTDADYNAWMNAHPDGRVAIGYRIGRYVVLRAIERSGRSVVELSALAPEEILELAGT